MFASWFVVATAPLRGRVSNRALRVIGNQSFMGVKQNGVQQKCTSRVRQME
jgi:hypothetical protein